MPHEASVPGCPVQAIVKVSLLMDLIKRTERCLRNELPRISERPRKVAGKIIAAPLERVQLQQAQTEREALDALGQPCGVHLLLLGVL